jgi:hypothetical protein
MAGANQRQKLVDAVKARLAAISVAGGYNHDLSGKVFVWRDISQGAASFQAAELPALNIRDTDGNPELLRLGNTALNNELLFEVDCVTKTDPVDENVRKLMADVYRAIGSDRYWTVSSVRLAQDTLPRGDAMAVVHGQNRYGQALIKFAIIHRTGFWNPETPGT